MMPERAYTVAEIDRMRDAVEHRLVFGYSIGDPHSGVMTSASYNGERMAKCVEERLRTYMLAGIEPEDLEWPKLP